MVSWHDYGIKMLDEITGDEDQRSDTVVDLQNDRTYEMNNPVSTRCSVYCMERCTL